MKILLTGFDPYGKDVVNPAWEAVNKTSNQIGNVEIVKLKVPTVFYKSINTVIAAMEKEKPDAIFCAADVFAISVIKAANRYKLRVPEDVGVVGFDNVEMASITNPGITTVNQPAFQIGFTAGETIYEKISNPNSKPRSILLDTELIARESIIRYQKEN